jgi:hypothetical protein
VITDLQRVGYVETAEEKSNRHLKNIQEFVGPRLAEMTTADRKALRIWNSEATTKADRVVRPFPMKFRPLEHLPLFADDAALGAALLGVARAGEWCQLAALLEARGLPKMDALMGGRYVPAIKAFFDRDYGLAGAQSPLAPDGIEDLGAWKKRKRRA